MMRQASFMGVWKCS